MKSLLYVLMFCCCSHKAVASFGVIQEPQAHYEEQPVTLKWAEALAKGKTLVAAGEFNEAARTLQQAAALAKRTGCTEKQLAWVFASLASTYATMGHFTESEKYYGSALAIIEKVDGHRSLSFAFVFGRLAMLPTQCSIQSEAVRVLRDALRSAGPNATSSDLAVLRRCYSQLLIASHHYREAGPVLVAELADSGTHADPHAKAALLSDLAMVRRSEKKYREAIELLKDAQALLDSSFENRTLAVALMDNLASNYFRLGSVSQAEITFREALALSESTLGRNHPTTGQILENYAVVLRKLGRRAEAEMVAAQVEEIYQELRRQNAYGFTADVHSLH